MSTSPGSMTVESMNEVTVVAVGQQSEETKPTAKVVLTYVKKWFCMVALTILAATHVSGYRYSRHRYTVANISSNGETASNATAIEPYIVSTVLFMAEVVKLVTCLLGLIVLSGFSLPTAASTLRKDLFVGTRDTLLMAWLAILYLLKNYTVLMALSFIDAPTFQVTYQTRFIFTVILAMAMLDMELTLLQLLSMLVLAAGVVIIQVSNAGDTASQATANPLLGLLITLVASFLTSYTNVHFEKVVKTTAPTLNVRYIELSLLSLAPAMAICFAFDWRRILTKGFFVGYDYWVWIVIFQLAYLGFMMALIVKYADNMLRLVSVSVSVVITSIISWLLIGDFSPRWTFALGAGLVISATLLYAHPISRTSRKLRVPCLNSRNPNKKRLENV